MATTASSILSIQVFICLASYTSSLSPTPVVMSKSLSVLHLRTTTHATEGETLMTLRERGPSWGFPPHQWGSRIPRTWKNILEASQLRQVAVCNWETEVWICESMRAAGKVNFGHYRHILSLAQFS